MLDKDNKMINEENIEKNMCELYTKYNSWIDAYNEIYEDIIKTNKYKTYTSIKSNFNGLFIYYLMKNNVDIFNFDSVIKNMFEKNTEEDISYGLSRFFEINNRTINIKDYVLLDKRNNDLSCWENMKNFFLDKDERYSNINKILLDKKELPYLLSIFKNIPSDKVGAIYMAGYHAFQYNFLNDLKELYPIINVCIKNDAFLLEKKGYYDSFLNLLLKDVSSEIYNKSIIPNESLNEKNNKMYQGLLKVVPNINEIIYERIIKIEEGKNKKIEIDMSLLNLCLTLNIDIFPILHMRYNNIYEQYVDKTSLRYDKNHNDIVDGFLIPLNIQCSKYDYIVDTKNIDINNTYESNLIWLKLLEIKIKTGQEVKMSIELTNYIMNQYQYSPEIKDDLEGEILLLYAEKYNNYLTLEKNIQCKNGIHKILKKI